MIKKKESNQRGGKEEGSIIMEADEKTHEMLLKRVKLNVEWRKCPVFNHINVKRCFNIDVLTLSVEDIIILLKVVRKRKHATNVQETLTGVSVQRQRRNV